MSQWAEQEVVPLGPQAWLIGRGRGIEKDIPDSVPLVELDILADVGLLDLAVRTLDVGGFSVGGTLKGPPSVQVWVGWPETVVATVPVGEWVLVELLLGAQRDGLGTGHSVRVDWPTLLSEGSGVSTIVEVVEIIEAGGGADGDVAIRIGVLDVRIIVLESTLGGVTVACDGTSVCVSSFRGIGAG